MKTPAQISKKKLVVDQSLLRNHMRTAQLTIFLCGPGKDHYQYRAREILKDHLTGFEGVTVTFGEDLERLGVAKKVSRSKVDLQSLESAYAHTVDFTVLLLESPGAIAELGTFSMLDSLRPRLYVAVPDQYYESQSYIARGPLSILANEHPDNVLYYPRATIEGLFARLAFPLAFYRFAASDGGYKYNQIARQLRRREEYCAYISKLRAQFQASFILAAINILPRPSFVDLMYWLNLHSLTIRQSLKTLFADHRIKKTSTGQYVPLTGLDDGLLHHFDPGKLSQRRAELLARNHGLAAAL